MAVAPRNIRTSGHTGGIQYSYSATQNNGQITGSGGHAFGGDDQLSVRCAETADIGQFDAEQRERYGGVDTDLWIRWFWESDGEGAEWEFDGHCGECGDEPACECGL